MRQGKIITPRGSSSQKFYHRRFSLPLPFLVSSYSKRIGSRKRSRQEDGPMPGDLTGGKGGGGEREREMRQINPGTRGKSPPQGVSSMNLD